MARQAGKIEPKDELAELLGIQPEAEPENEAPAAVVEESAPETEPQPEPEVEPTEEPEPVAAEAEKPTIPVEDERTRREKGLRAEIAKLRRELRQQQQAETARFAPMPTVTPPIEAVPKKPAGVPVRVSEDGSSVYVDPAELERLVEDRAAKTLEERLKPTPEQVKAATDQRVIQSFVAEDPERHAAVWRDTGEAYQYLQLALRNAMQQTGATAYTAEDLVEIARETGLDAQFAEYFPQLSEHLAEMIQADVQNSVAWKASIMRRVARGYGEPEAEAPAIARPVIPSSVRPLRSVTNAPKSLARRGGERSPAPSVDQAEFDQLEREFRRDLVFFPPEKRRRLEELGVKLQKSGYV